MKICGAMSLFVLTLFGCWINGAAGQEIAICGTVPDENWVATVELEKTSELKIHLEYINRICKLDAKQHIKLDVAAKMVVNRIVKKAEQQQEGMMGPGMIDPGFNGGPIPEFEDVEFLIEERGPNVDQETGEEQIGDLQVDEVMDNNQDPSMGQEYVPSDEDYLYGTPLMNHKLWKSTVAGVLTKEQNQRLADADKARFERTYQVIVERTALRIANTLYLDPEQSKKFSELCHAKMRTEVENEYARSGQVYDHDGMIYATTTAEEVSKILTETQMKRWEVLTRHW